MGSGPGGSQAGGQNARHSQRQDGHGGVLFSSRPAGDTGQARTAPAHGFKSSTDSNHSASGAARVRHNRPTQGARQGAFLSPSIQLVTPDARHVQPFAEN